MKNLIILSSLLFAFHFSEGQNFTHKSPISKVDKKGFYAIPILPSITQYCQAQTQDLRIFDDQGKEIPYLLRQKNESSTDENFEEFGINTNENNGDWQTIVISNPNKKAISQIIFEMMNAETDRSIIISGSNDMSKWFVVKDSTHFNTMDMQDEANIKLAINFPKTQYSYYKFEINNKNKEQLNIQKAGILTNKTNLPRYQKIENIQFSRKKVGKNTIINVISNPSQCIDQISFKISEPKMFHRMAKVRYEEISDWDNKYTASSNNMNSKKYRGEQNQLLFVLETGANTYINTTQALGYTKADSISIEIENENNEPLQFSEIQAFQFNKDLVAELKPDRNYFLYFGDSSLISPNYDLIYFQKQLEHNIPFVTVGKMSLQNETLKDEYDDSKDRYMVWIGLAAVAGILLWLTFGMLKNMKTEEGK